MKSNITPFLIIAICIAAYFMYLSPEYEKMKMVRDERDRYAEVLEKARNISAKRDEMLTQYNSISVEDTEKLKKVVPAQFDAPSMANDINFMASRNGALVEAFDFSFPEQNNSQVVLEESNPSPFQTIRLSFNVIATYPQFLAFLSSVEQNLQLIDIHSIKIGEASDAGVNTMNFSIEAYTYALR